MKTQTPEQITGTAADRASVRLTVRLLRAAGAALPILVALAVFLPTLRYAFITYDVTDQLLYSPLVRSLRPGNLFEMFTSFQITSYYPVRLLSLAIDYHFWALNPFGYHLTNLILHIANTALLFTLFVRVTSAPTSRARWCAAAAATLFAIHPVVVEPVIWTAGREELLALLFTLAAVHAYISALAPAGGGKARRSLLAASAVFCACACMSNAVAIVMPALLAAWELCFVPAAVTRATSRLRATLRHMWPMACIAACALALKLAGKWIASAALPHTHLPVLHGMDRFTITPTLYALNLFSTFYPAKLALLYPHPAVDGITRSWIAGLGFLLAVGTVGLLLAVRRHRVVLFGLLWFLLALSPALQFLPHHIARADRFLYLPLPGLALALGGLLAGPIAGRSPGIRATAWMCVVSVCLVSAAQARRQATTWRDSVSLFSHNVRLFPESTDAHRNLGIALSTQQRDLEALEAFEAALRLQPRDAAALANKGQILNRLGRTREAMDCLRSSLSLWPGSAELHNNTGAALYRQGDLAGSIRESTEAVRLNPRLADAWNQLGAALQATGEFTRAEECLRKAIELRPDLADARSNMGMLLSRKGDYKGALAEYREALRINPKMPEAHDNLGIALMRLGQPAEALVAFRTAAALAPDQAQTRVNLGYALASSGDFSGAETQFGEALRLNPSLADAHYNLAAMLLRRNQAAAALAHLHEAARLNPNDPEIPRRIREAETALKKAHP